MKNVVIKYSLGLLLLIVSNISYASSCEVRQLENISFQNESINLFEWLLSKFYSDEIIYIWVEKDREVALWCSVNETYKSIVDINKTLSLLDQSIKTKDMNQFKLKLQTLKLQIPSFLSARRSYSQNKIDYEEQKTVIKSVVVAKEISTINWVPSFSNIKSLFQSFVYRWQKNYIKSDINWQIEYYLVDSKDQISKWAPIRNISSESTFSFYLEDIQQYWFLDLSKYPLTKIIEFETLKNSVWLYIDKISYSLDWKVVQEDLTSILQLTNTIVTVNWKEWILWSSKIEAYSFNNSNEVESYFQNIDSSLLKDYIVIKVWTIYYITKIKTLEVWTLKTLSNNIMWLDSQYSSFLSLNSFKNESFDKLTFIGTNNNTASVKLIREPVFIWVSNVFLTYVDNSNYEIQLKEYLKNYTTISFWEKITLYYNRVDNMKKLLVDKLNELNNYGLYASNIKNSNITNIELIELWSTRNNQEELIFKTYKWVSKNISYDEKTKNDVVLSSKLWKMSWQMNLESNKSHFWIYTLQNRLWVCDWISILFTDLLKQNWVQATIITWVDKKSWIWHALVKVWENYYDPTNDLLNNTQSQTSTWDFISKWFYKMSEEKLSIYFLKW